MDSQGVGLVVVFGLEATLTCDLEHDVLAGVALAGPVLLDRPGRDGLVGDVVGLTPSRERGEETAVDVTSGNRGRALLHLLEADPIEPITAQVVEEAHELEVAHATPLVAPRLERLSSALLLALAVSVDVRHAPAGLGAEVKRKQFHLSFLSFTAIW